MMPGGFRGMGGGGGLEEMYMSIPPVTRALMTAIFGTSILIALQLLPPQYIMFHTSMTFRKLHLWRLVTDFFFIGPFSFGWLITMYFFSQYSSRLEEHPAFSPRFHPKGQYLFFLTFQMVALTLLGALFFPPDGRPFNGGSLAFAVIYYYSKKEPYQQANLWGFTLDTWKLPYALIVINILLGGGIWQDLLGLASGHLYHYLRDVLPLEKNYAPLKNPPAVFGMIEEKLDFSRPVVAAPTPTSTRSEFGGGGRRLGGDS